VNHCMHVYPLNKPYYWKFCPTNRHIAFITLFNIDYLFNPWNSASFEAIRLTFDVCSWWFCGFVLNDWVHWLSLWHVIRSLLQKSVEHWQINPMALLSHPLFRFLWHIRIWTIKIKWKTKNTSACRNSSKILKSIIKIVTRGKLDTPYTQIHDLTPFAVLVEAFQ
jgi:hypothetical protein